MNDRYQTVTLDPAAQAARLATVLARWSLRSRGELAGGFRCAVFDCVSALGDEVVVKLPPRSDEALAEAAALRQWADSGVALRLVDYDAEQHALLLPRVRPGTHLPPGDEVSSLDAVSGVLAKLHKAPPGHFPFPRLAEIYPPLERRALTDIVFERRTRAEPKRGEEGLIRMAAARRQAMHLCASATRNVLLHGDILDKNLLWDGTRYLAADPIPTLGDPCSDVGFFAAGHRPVGGVFERASAISLRLGLDPQRALRWAAVWVVHQACQAWRDDQSELDALCASANLQSLLAGSD